MRTTKELFKRLLPIIGTMSPHDAEVLLDMWWWVMWNRGRHDVTSYLSWLKEARAKARAEFEESWN